MHLFSTQWKLPSVPLVLQRYVQRLARRISKLCDDQCAMPLFMCLGFQETAGSFARAPGGFELVKSGEYFDGDFLYLKFRTSHSNRIIFPCFFPYGFYMFLPYPAIFVLFFKIPSSNLT